MTEERCCMAEERCWFTWEIMLVDGVVYVEAPKTGGVQVGIDDGFDHLVVGLTPGEARVMARMLQGAAAAAEERGR